MTLSTEMEIVLSLNRALLGAVPACLRSVSFQLEGDLIRLRFLFDGPVSEDDEEGARIVGTEVIADFHAPLAVREEIVRLDYPEPFAGQTLAHHVYERKERTIVGMPDPRLST